MGNLKYGLLNTCNKLWQQSPKWRGSALLKPDFWWFLLWHTPHCNASFSYAHNWFISLSLCPLYFHPSVLTWRSIGQSANELDMTNKLQSICYHCYPCRTKEHPGKPSSSCAFAIVGFAIQIAVVNSHPAEFGWVKREATLFLDNKSFIFCSMANLR